MGARPPNILYIHSHDTGRYLQPYGHDVPTPSRVQSMAEQGVLFRRAFSAAPTCSPSRACAAHGTMRPRLRNARPGQSRIHARPTGTSPRPHTEKGRAITRP